MRKIALGIICSSVIASSAWAADPTTTTTRLVTSGALDGVTFTAPARAEQAAPAPAPAAAPAPAPKKVTTTVGADFPTSYYFRGYRQESDADFTFQPFVDVAVKGDAVTFNTGLWNSFHTGSLKDGGNGYYETDFYAAATVKNIKTTYTAYTYPDDFEDAIHELMFSTSFSNVLSPSAALAFEFSKSSGANKGIYLELGVSPGIPMKDGAKFTLTVPVKFGFGLDEDYYGGDQFGYFSGGVSVGVPLSKGELHGSVTFYGFGTYLKDFNGKSGDTVGSIGYSIGF